MVVVAISNDKYTKTLAHLIQRDYFPLPNDYVSHQAQQKQKGGGRTNNDGIPTPSTSTTTKKSRHRKSLTDFHSERISKSTQQIQNAFQEKASIETYKQSLIYQKKPSVSTSHDTNVKQNEAKAELRNALFFPLAITDNVVQVANSSTGASGDTGTVAEAEAAERMPPPPKRKRQRNEHDIDNTNNKRARAATTTTTILMSTSSKAVSTAQNLDQEKEKKKKVFINPAATRFPTPTRRSSSSSRRKRDSYSDNINDKSIAFNHRHHWEGSTIATGRDDDDSRSVFTDLDATTVDSYSIRSELRKAKNVVMSQQKNRFHPSQQQQQQQQQQHEQQLIKNVLPTSYIYQLPAESSRDRIAAAITLQHRTTPSRKKGKSKTK